MAKGTALEVDDEEKGQTLDAYERLRSLIDPTQYEASLMAMWQALQQNAMAIEAMATQFKDRAQAERTALRRDITQRHRAQHGPGSKVQTSKMILSCSARLEGLELFWAEVWYLGQDKTPRYNRIPNRTAGPDLRLLMKGAHPEEVPLISSHEKEARELRARWKEHIEFKWGVRKCINRALKQREAVEALEAEDGD
jgi:hypothetical protein